MNLSNGRRCNISQQGRLVDIEAGLDSLTGNSGGPVSPDGVGNINILGAGNIDVTGNPGTNTLTITETGGIASQYDTDSGSATPSLGILEILGTAAQGIDTSGAGNTVTITAQDATTTQKGVLETSTDAESIAGSSTAVAVTPASLAAKLGIQTANTIPYAQGATSALAYTAAATDGQLVIGATGAPPAFASLASAGGTITFTPGANTLNLETSGATSNSFPTDSGTATPAAGVLNVLGTAAQGIDTSGAGNTVTVTAQDATTTQKGVLETSTDAESIAGTSTTVGVTPASLAAKLGTQTDDSLAVFNTTTAALSDTGALTDGQLAIGATGATPLAASLTSADSTIAFTPGANTLDLVTGSSVATAFDPDTGANVSPVAGVLTCSGVNGMTTSNGGAGVLNITNFRSTTPYVVSTSAASTTYTSIQTAINQAVTDGASAAAPRVVFIRPGVYTENITLAPFVNLTSGGMHPNNDLCTITGNATANITGNVSISGIRFNSTNASNAFSITGANVGTYLFTNCTFAAANAAAICYSCANTNATVRMRECSINPQSVSTPVNVVGNHQFISCIVNSLALASVVSNSVIWLNCNWLGALTVNTATIASFVGGQISSGTASCATVAGGGLIAFKSCYCTSSAASGNYIAGTGLAISENVSPNGTAKAIVGTITKVPFVNTVGNLSFDGGGTSLTSNGQLVIGNVSGTPSIGTLTAGTGISVVNGAGTITVSATGSGLTWTEVTGTSQAMAVNNGYIANNAGLVTLTLPATAALGATIHVTGKGAGGWRIAQNAGQQIHFGTLSTTVGATGRLDSTATRDSIEVVCVTANTSWNVISSIGNITVT